MDRYELESRRVQRREALDKKWDELLLKTAKEIVLREYSVWDTVDALQGLILERSQDADALLEADAADEREPIDVHLKNCGCAGCRAVRKAIIETQEFDSIVMDDLRDEAEARDDGSERDCLDCMARSINEVHPCDKHSESFNKLLPSARFYDAHPEIDTTVSPDEL